MANQNQGASIEAAARAIYESFLGAHAHPWVEGGNSNKQDEARRYARVALEAARRTPAGAGELPPLPEPFDHVDMADGSIQGVFSADQYRTGQRAAIEADRAQLARQGQGDVLGFAIFCDGRQVGIERSREQAAGWVDAQVVPLVAHAAPASARPADPMDWPLPCDVTVGSGTMKKGTALRLLVKRMETLHGMAMDGLKSTSAQPDRGAAPDDLIEAAAKAIYARFDGAREHPWVERGNSNKQDEARLYARAALRPAPHSQPVRGVPDDQLRQLLQEFVDYHTEPAGLTLETPLDADRLGEFLGNVEAREKDMVARAKAMLAADPSPAARPGHPDDLAVDRFAAAMRDKMAKKRIEGRGGWDDPSVCPVARLQTMLIDHLPKGDPVDVANFCMMLWNRGQPTTTWRAAPPSAEEISAMRAAAQLVAQVGEQSEPPSTKQEKLRALADRIDHEKLWRRPGIDRLMGRLTDEQCDRLDAGVELRRYADLLAPGRWLVLPPTGNVQFSAGSLDKVYEMAKRGQDRRKAQQAQPSAKGGDVDTIDSEGGHHD